MSYLVAMVALALSGLVVVQARSTRLENLLADGAFLEARRVSPYSAAPLHRLALAAEAAGRNADAERLLKNAVSLDHGVLPRWTLAGYYLRRQSDSAWPLLAEAVRIALHGGQDANAMFEAAWQVHPEAAFVLRNVVGDVQKTREAYVRFLLATNRPGALPEAVLGVSDPDLLLQAADAMVTHGDYQGALASWNRALPPRHDGELLTNPELRTPRQLGFDWRYNSLPESPLRFGDGLAMAFTGRQPDPWELLSQIVPASPGRFKFAWESKAADAGLQWQITDAQTGTVLLRVPVRLGKLQETFTVHSSPAIRLALISQRLPGTTRFEGSAWIGHPSLRQL